MSKETVAPDRVEPKVPYSTEPTSPFWNTDVMRKRAPPAVSEFGPLLPAIAMRISFAFDVVTPVIEGWLLPPVPVWGRVKFGSNGNPGAIPEKPTAIISVR